MKQMFPVWQASAVRAPAGRSPNEGWQRRYRASDAAATCAGCRVLILGIGGLTRRRSASERPRYTHKRSTRSTHVQVRSDLMCKPARYTAGSQTTDQITSTRRSQELLSINDLPESPRYRIFLRT